MVKEKDLEIRSLQDRLQALKTHSAKEIAYVHKETEMKIEMVSFLYIASDSDFPLFNI